MAGAQGQAKGLQGVPRTDTPQHPTRGASCPPGVGPVSPRAAACRRRPGSFARGFSTPVHATI